MKAFETDQYVLLAAQMQSGKTGTFMYVAEQMLMNNKVDQVVIFSGNRESLLKKQTLDRVGDLKNVHVVWGHNYVILFLLMVLHYIFGMSRIMVN